MFKHILIATDGSPLANKAAKAGIALASALGVKVTAYFALENLQSMFVDGYAFDQTTIDRLEAGARRAGQKHVDAVGKMAQATGVPCTLLVTNVVTA
ncbi:MAG TPA: universal stress protein, partial [Candidatus Binatia bacterium]|nr:universal stress protein [Candidatus Binatia bacterium]